MISGMVYSESCITQSSFKRSLTYIADSELEEIIIIIDARLSSHSTTIRESSGSSPEYACYTELVHHVGYVSQSQSRSMMIVVLDINDCLRSRTTLGSTPEIATFAAGCFWGVEHIFLKYYPIKENKGILKTSVGYTGGYEQATNPDYKTVCSGSTNHAEALRIEFDPSVVKYEELVGEYGVLILLR